MAVVNFDMSQFREFFQRMDKAAKGDLREELETYLEAVGFDFLRVVQDEIVRRKVVDTRLLLSSFERGGSGNVWQLEDNGLTLEVGTNVKYAKFVEDGHWTNPKGWLCGLSQASGKATDSSTNQAQKREWYSSKSGLKAATTLKVLYASTGKHSKRAWM